MTSNYLCKDKYISGVFVYKISADLIYIFTNVKIYNRFTLGTSFKTYYGYFRLIELF